MSFNAYTPPGFWDRTRFARFGFIAGLVVGVLIGWFFHGVVSLILRLGFVIALLIPLAIVIWLWWRSTRAPVAPTRTQRSIQWVDLSMREDPRRPAEPDPRFRYQERPGDILIDLDDTPPSQGRESR